MRSPAVSLLLLAAIILASGSPVQGAGVRYGEIEISPEIEPRGNPAHGYTEYRFQVKNHGSGGMRVTLQIPGDTSSRHGKGSLTSITRGVDVAPGGITSISLLQPSMPDISGHGMAVYLNGRKQESLYALSLVSGLTPPHMMYSRRRGRGFYGMTSSRGATNEAMILTTQRVPEAFFKVPITFLPHAGGMMLPGAGMPGIGSPVAPKLGVGVGPPPEGPPFAMQLIRSELSTSIWSSDWLAYTRYDGIIVTTEDLDDLQRGGTETRAVLQALWQYVETGGALVVLGQPKSQARVPLPASYDRNPRQVNGLLVYPVGFGTCIVGPDRDSKAWTENARWETLRISLSDTSRTWQNTRNIIDLNRSFAVVDDLGVPVKGLFALMVLFGITMGPVNLVMLTRYRKRIWLLWTVPALAATFCLAVLGYMIVAEGWQGHSRIAGLTLLDEGEKRATTLGRSAFYSPLTPGDGLRFSTTTEVQLLGDEHSAWSNSCSIHWADDQHLARGWISARIPAYFAVRKSEPLRRERLTLRQEADGGLTVVNALGADIEHLWLADEKGQLHRAESIPAGSSARLEKTNRTVSPGIPGEAWRQLYVNENWVNAALAMRGEPAKYLGPGTYLAVINSSPFLEPGLKNAHARPTESVVLGLMADLAGKR